MCIQTALQQKIAELTGNGETIAIFLADTMQSDSYAIKTCHKLDAARLLTKYGFAQVEGKVIPFDPTGDEPSTDNSKLITDNSKLTTDNSKLTPTLRDIVAYPIARYIRDRTNEGETLIEALCDIIHDDGEYDSQAAQGFGYGGVRPHAKPHHKLAAASELLRRALGESTRRRKSASYDPEADIDDAEPINGHLAKLVRDKTSGGTEAAELLIRIAEDDRSDGDWTAAHRVSAARELLHRAYDLNYEAVSWEHVQAYKQATDFADEGATLEHARIQAGRNALLREFNEAYESGDEEAAQEAEDKYNAYNRYITEGKTPEDAMTFATCGPNDPDPEELHTQNPAHPVTPVHPEPVLSAVEGAVEGRDRKHTAAAQIPTPRLTIPINNRSP